MDLASASSPCLLGAGCRSGCHRAATSTHTHGQLLCLQTCWLSCGDRAESTRLPVRELLRCTLYLGSIRLNMGAFLSMSGMVMNLHAHELSEAALATGKALLHELGSPDRLSSNEDVF